VKDLWEEINDAVSFLAPLAFMVVVIVGFKALFWVLSW
jgi:hypothetical protein